MWPQAKRKGNVVLRRLQTSERADEGSGTMSCRTSQTGTAQGWFILANISAAFTAWASCLWMESIRDPDGCIASSASSCLKPEFAGANDEGITHRRA